MTTMTLPITSEAEWLGWRAQDITSTESAALFGISPYATPFELWHRKRDQVVEQIVPEGRMLWGQRLQDAIATGVAADMHWKARRLDVYMRDPEDRIGSSFDFEVECPKRGRGLMEIKNVDSLIYRDQWIENGSEIEAPKHIELQVQHEAEVADVDWVALVALVGGNTPKIVIRERERDIGRHIRAKVREFWRTVEAGTPPKPDYDLDAEFLCRLHGNATEGLEIEADPDLEQVLAMFHRARQESKKWDTESVALKAQILERIGPASKVKTSFGTLSAGEVKASPGTLITPEMVGTRVGARAGYRMCKFTPKKEKAK